MRMLHIVELLFLDDTHRKRLIDEYFFALYPIILGGGKRLFQNADQVRRLHLVDSKLPHRRPDPYLPSASSRMTSTADAIAFEMGELERPTSVERSARPIAILG